MKRKLFVATAAFAVISISSALADPPFDPPPLTKEEIILNNSISDLLKNESYAVLDKTMNDYQLAYEAGKLDEISLLHIYRTFYDVDPGLEKNYEAWINAYPKSYAAREARGTYLTRVGYMIRGSDYINQTPKQNIIDMQAYVARSTADHKIAMHLTKKPIITYYNILRNSKLIGDRETAKTMLDLANDISPQNFIVRYKYLAMLEPRWGGSLNQMAIFKNEAEKAGVDKELLTYFDELIIEQVKQQRR